MPALIRVGHKGADAIVRGNTAASFDAALAAGVDMIEFDVLAERPDGSGELLVAHDYGIVRRYGAPTLAAALAHLASPRFAAVRLQVDLKRSGYERGVIGALDAAGLAERSFVSTGELGALARVRALAPELRLGWTVPDVGGVCSRPLLSQTAGRVFRRALIRRAAERLAAREIDALVPQWPLVDGALVEAVRGAGAELYAWTVDDAAQIARLAALGVTGVITNDPRLFATLS
ncbi:MAG TPA: glycerophosphodiester phosphodiesterase [Solirubrobacteraceae bacterium]|nr:glycerophosphodiester phosphodiesterase [Solirubrobacteraceae bacterium]